MKTATADPAAVLAGLRSRIDTLRGQIDATADALPPLDEALAQFDAWTLERAKRFTPAVGPLLRPQGRRMELFAPMDVHKDGATAAFGIFSAEIEALLCTILADRLRDLFEAALRARIEAASLVLTADEKAKQLAGMQDQLLRLYAEEERIVRRSEALGAPLDRRADAEPEFVLATDAALAAA